MISTEKRLFVRKALILCLLLSAVSLIIFLTFLRSYYLTIFPFQIGIIALVTIFSHLKLMDARQKNARGFSTVFLSTMMIKLLIYMAFILGYLLVDKTNAINFVLTFFVLYLVFTAFEVREISIFLKKNQNSSN